MAYSWSPNEEKKIVRLVERALAQKSVDYDPEFVLEHDEGRWHGDTLGLAMVGLYKDPERADHAFRKAWEHTPVGHVHYVSPGMPDMAAAVVLRITDNLADRIGFWEALGDSLDTILKRLRGELPCVHRPRSHYFY